MKMLFKFDYIILFQIIKFCIISRAIASIERKFFLEYSSFITLKIKNSGFNNVYNDYEYCKDDNSISLPDEIYINGKNQTEIKNIYYFEHENNDIKIIFHRKIIFANCIFGGAKNITEVDLSNFNTSEMEQMFGFFAGCFSLTSINFTNFKSDKVLTMFGFFTSCYSLISVDLSNFETKNVIVMNWMFSFCHSLRYLDLSNFNTQNLIAPEYTFRDSPLLEFINLDSSFHFTENNITISEILIGTSENLVICTKDSLLISHLQCEININCNYPSGGLSIYICNRKCSSKINGGFLCEKCGKNYYPKYNDASNTNTNIECYESIEYYFVNKYDNIYPSFMLCYEKCYSCERKGNESIHNCIECKSDYKYLLIISDSDSDNVNCLINCSYYHYYNKISNKTYCTSEFKCPKKFKNLILNKSECIDECFKDSEYKYEYQNSCYLNCPNNTFKVSYHCYDISLNENIRSDVIYNTSNINNKIISDIIIDNNNNDNIMKNWSGLEEIIFYLINKSDILDIYNNNNETKFETKIKNKDLIITLTTTNNKKIEEKKGKTSINLKECEYILKTLNNISLNESLLISEIQIKEDGIKIPIIEYQIYDKNLTKLNLNLCEKEKIDISIPIKINDTIDKYNPKSDYYNNICNKTYKFKKVDITLKDRRFDFINNNMSLCEEICEFIDYNFMIEKVKCSCLVKINLSLLKDIKFDKDKLLKSFTDFKNIANIMLMKCYKDVFKIQYIKNNYGFLIIAFIFILYFISLIIFYSQLKNFFKNNVYKIINAKNKILYSINKKSNSISNVKNGKKKERRSLNKLRNYNINTNIKNNKSFPPKKIKLRKKGISKTHNFGSSIMNLNKRDKKKSQIENNKNNNINIKEYQNILEYHDNELNLLSYNIALKKDKRSYIQYYISLIRKNNLFIFTFFRNSDYNSKILKIFLLFFCFNSNFAANILFFDDSTMNKIYIDGYKFINHIAQIIYSALISNLINGVIKYISLSEKNILKLKTAKRIIKTNEVIRLMKIKFAIFFIISFLLISFYLFYVSCFCGIYVNTQINLIKDNISSFILSQLYPFVISLMPGFFRLSALKDKKKNRKYLYLFSKLIQ